MLVVLVETMAGPMYRATEYTPGVKVERHGVTFVEAVQLCLTALNYYTHYDENYPNQL